MVQSPCPKGLTADPDYRAAIAATAAAKREYDRIRAAVLAESHDWQEADVALRTLRADHRQDRDRGTGALGVVSAARTHRNAEEIAAAARQVIAIGEARLRQLGEKVPASTASSMVRSTVKK